VWYACYGIMREYGLFLPGFEERSEGKMTSWAVSYPDLRSLKQAADLVVVGTISGIAQVTTERQGLLATDYLLDTVRSSGTLPSACRAPVFSSTRKAVSLVTSDARLLVFPSLSKASGVCCFSKCMRWEARTPTLLLAGILLHASPCAMASFNR
jgi:hypothetical protein